MLSAAVTLTVGRNICSKYLSRNPFGSRAFFLMQGVMFFAGALCLALACIGKPLPPSPAAFRYAAAYALLLVSSQWCYTASLKYGNVSICSTMYSLGFIIPTLAGPFLWNEELTPKRVLGILLIIPAICLSVKKGEKTHQAGFWAYGAPLLAAMFSSGALGVLQKAHQRSAYAEERAVVIVLAFLFALAASFLAALLRGLTKGGEKGAETVPIKARSPERKKQSLCAALAGICFGSCNLLNTTLAGKLDSAVLFPVLNIGVIVLSMVAGWLFFRERLQKKDYTVIILGIAAVLLLAA